MVVWNGKDIVGLIVLCIAILCIVLWVLFVTITDKAAKKREKRWKRIADKFEEKATCYGCKHLWMSNVGAYECLINGEKACIDNKANKRYLYEAYENEEVKE